MKVEVNSQALADAVAWTTRVIDARPASPILAGIRLEAIDGTLQLSAFNYAISARHHIEAGVDESGSIWCSASCWQISPSRFPPRKPTCPLTDPH